MFVPLGTENIVGRRPIANWVLMAVTALAYFATAGDLRAAVFRYGAGGAPLGIVAHVLIHVDLWHLLGNLLFLWMFGDVLCSRFGALRYLVGYFGLGAFVGLVHSLLESRIGVGASGAINGVIGFYAACFPLTRIAFWFVPVMRTVRISGIWVIALWFVMDVVGALGDSGSTGYVAHVAGFLGGLGLGVAALRRGWIHLDPDDLRSLPELFGGTGGPVRAATARPAKVEAASAQPADAAPRVVGTTTSPPRVAVPRRTTEPARPRVVAAASEAFVTRRCGCGWSLELPRVYAAEVTACERCRAPLDPA